MKRLALMIFALLVAGGAYAQVTVLPGTPAQVNRALSEAPGEWADAAIELVVSRGIYIGYPDGSFGWRDEITRAEMAVVIARLIQSYGLDDFDASELVVLRRAVAELQDDMAGLLALVEEHDRQLDEVADALDRHEGQIADLWDAITTLDVAPEAFDASALWLAITELEAAVAANDADLADLHDRLLALEEDSDDDLNARIRTLEVALEASLAERAAMAAELDALHARVSALEADSAVQGQLIIDLDGRLGTMSERLTGIEARLARLETDMAEVMATLADHEERITQLEQTTTPDRAPFHISLALYGSAPDGGLVGQVAVGHDAVIGNMGVRATVDFGFQDVPLSISGAATYRATMNSIDGYAGIGLGVSFEQDGSAMFGELLLGINYRIARNFGLFIEGRYRPYFDGSGDGLAALGGGVQLRF